MVERRHPLRELGAGDELDLVGEPIDRKRFSTPTLSGAS